MMVYAKGTVSELSEYEGDIAVFDVMLNWNQ